MACRLLKRQAGGLRSVRSRGPVEEANHTKPSKPVPPNQSTLGNPTNSPSAHSSVLQRRRPHRRLCLSAQPLSGRAAMSVTPRQSPGRSSFQLAARAARLRASICQAVARRAGRALAVALPLRAGSARRAKAGRDYYPCRRPRPRRTEMEPGAPRGLWFGGGTVGLRDVPHCGSQRRTRTNGSSYETGGGVWQPQVGSPRNASRPSRTRSGVMSRAARGSAHHQPKAPLRARPPRVMRESHQHAVV